VRVFKTKWFVRFARRQSISDAMLLDAIALADQGLIEADLGGDVIKQRVARAGEGKRGGYRVLVFYRRRGDRAVFLYGFPKNARANVDDDELATLQEQAKAWRTTPNAQLDVALRDSTLTEIVR